MKITKKIDDSYRLLIPQEIRKAVGCNKYDEVDLEYIESSNEVILTFKKNESEAILEDQKDESSDRLDAILDLSEDKALEQPTKKDTLEEDIELNIIKNIVPVKMNITEVKEKPIEIKIEEIETKIEEPIIKSIVKSINKKSKVVFKDTDIISFIEAEDLKGTNYCPKCNYIITDVNMTGLKVNDKILCSDCLKLMKKQILNK